MPKDKNNGREMTPDEKFRSFFSTTAVDIPEEMTRRDENQPEEKPQKRFGLFGRGKEKQETDEAAAEQPQEMPTGEVRLGEDAQPEPVQLAFQIFQLGHSGRFLSGSGGRRCGASNSAVATGHRAASANGASSNHQPGKLSPTARRTISDTACAAAKRGRTWSNWSTTPNHSRRRWMVMAR